MTFFVLSDNILFDHYVYYMFLNTLKEYSLKAR